MGFFRRKDGGSDHRAQPDPLFPQLSVDDVAWIRSTAQQVLAGHGIEVTVDNGGADLVADGARYPLDNVVLTCVQLSRAEWAAHVEQHFGAVSRMYYGPTVDDLSYEQLLTRVRTRVLPVDALEMGGIDLRTYARPVADDLAAVLCVDFPETVGYLDSARAATLPLDELFAAGQRNTDAEPIDEIAQHGPLTLVTGESVFTSSKILAMAPLVRQVFGHDAPCGVVFAVPDRHGIIMHPVASPEAVSAIGLMTQIAHDLYGKSPWSVSPHTYYWYRGTIARVGSADPETRNIDVVPTDDLLNFLNGFGNSPHRPD